MNKLTRKYRIIIRREKDDGWKILRDNLSFTAVTDGLGCIIGKTKRPWKLQQKQGCAKTIPAYNAYMITRKLDEIRTLEAIWENKDLGVKLKIQIDE